MTLQDKLLAWSTEGFYVEAGAHDGIGDSQTYALEQAGWHGICVEPSGAYIGLRRHRKCYCDARCLWNTDNEEVTFREIAGNAVELSGILTSFGDHHEREKWGYKDRRIATVTLTTLLRTYAAPKMIDFLCLDTEGSELSILSAHDFTAYTFNCIMVEYNGVVGRRNALLDLLLSKGFILDHDDETNLILRSTN